MIPVKIKVEMAIPHNVLILNNIFTFNGFELYLVGGAVRDFLLGNTIKDYDLVTNALPDEIERILKDADVKTIPTGKQFGIINAFVGNDEFELATFREDSSTGDGRRPDSVTFSDIKTDVNRRDLTINALFYNIEDKEIVDYVGGINDLKKGFIRTVGEPAKRFEEDKLRILRAIRFANRTGNTLDPKIDEFLLSGYDLSEVSSERIRDEFLKSIKSAKSVITLMRTYNKYGMFKWIFPGLLINEHFIDFDDHIVVLTILLLKNDMGSLAKVLNNLNYTVNEIRNVKFLESFITLSPNTAPRLKKAQKNTTIAIDSILEFAYIMNIAKPLVNAFNKYELSVNGLDVMKRYDLNGPELGKVIEEMEINNFNQILNK